MEPMTKQQRHECLWSNYQMNSRLDLWIKEYFDVLLLFLDWLVVSLLIIVFCCWYLSVYQMLPWNVFKRLRTDRKTKTKHPGITFQWIWWWWNHHKPSDTINVHWMTCCEAKGLLPTFISISVAQGWLKHRKESKLWLSHGVGYCSCENISMFSQLEAVGSHEFSRYVKVGFLDRPSRNHIKQRILSFHRWQNPPMTQ